ncbi:SPASM domain-containing protein [Streptomyces violaceoruber]|uniref:radical SAM/SPASM domain-containing protein n=1 Tax=Streptomyces violaceoruber TaxID=1935 RepID=UPI001F3B8855|nr:radical SAM protein [Streptomyces violaceoruber]MCF3165782.1 SPASM domain-containing protein [Streptomyces violaceoruber]
MYLTPFFSYRRVEDSALLKNHVTGREAMAPWQAVGDLQALYDSPTSTGPVPAVADELGIVFPDKDACDAWLDAHDSRGVGRLPKIEQIELTNRCPYTCHMCPRTFEMERELGDMSLKLFDSVMSQISGHTDFLALHHFGESLLHRGLPDAIRIAAGHGIRTGLSCNPPSLLPKRAEAILDAGITNLVLSLDSLDPEVYKSIRGRAARMDVADRNLRELVRMRDSGGYDTTMTLQMISMRANQDEAEAFLEYCADVGVDRGVVIRLERWDFDDEKVASLGEHTSPGYTAPCSRPWKSVAVLWDGRVVPCCHDYDGELVLGDLRKETLEEIWANPVAREFRERNGEAAICAKCAFGQSFREARREREGFHVFHQEMTDESSYRWEWFNPRWLDERNTRRWYDGFDVLTETAS